MRAKIKDAIGWTYTFVDAFPFHHSQVSIFAGC